MPRKKIVIRKAPRTKQLLDQRAVFRPPDRLGRTAFAILGVGLLVGGAAAVYFLYFYKPVLKEYHAAQIIVPPPTAGRPAPAPAATTTPAALARMVRILDTPTGYLNVRKGAGAIFEKIAKVQPGEQYDLISEVAINGGWIQIRLNSTTTGWVSKKYGEVK